MADLEYRHVDHDSPDKFHRVRQIMSEASILFGKSRIGNLKQNSFILKLLLNTCFSNLNVIYICRSLGGLY